jgi:hypothetical protein
LHSAWKSEACTGICEQAAGKVGNADRSATKSPRDDNDERVGLSGTAEAVHEAGILVFGV